MEKLIITVAPTGSVPKKKDTPHVPVTPEEIVTCALRCEDEGASILHIHVRDQQEAPSDAPELFREVVEGLRGRSRLILQVSTGGRAGTGLESRSQRLQVRPEMASLTTGSVNFPTTAYVNPPDLVEGLAKEMKRLGVKPEMEVFDVSMVYNALDLLKKGLAAAPLHFNFVMGLAGAIPASVDHLVHLRGCLPPESTWTVTGVRDAQLLMVSTRYSRAVISGSAWKTISSMAKRNWPPYYLFRILEGGRYPLRRKNPSGKIWVGVDKEIILATDRESSEVEAFQITVTLCKALKVCWLLTHWPKASLSTRQNSPIDPSQRSCSPQTERTSREGVLSDQRLCMTRGETMAGTANM